MRIEEIVNRIMRRFACYEAEIVAIAETTKSVYIRFKKKNIGTVRVSNHPAFKEKPVRFEIRADLSGKTMRKQPKAGYLSRFYGFDVADLAMKDIERELRGRTGHRNRSNLRRMKSDEC